MTEQPSVRRAMISSTALDLPEHRKHARDACERMSMLPLVMEQMPASPADALALSRGYVDQADFYLGILAFRYGFVPEGQDKSITELEYDRAIEREIPTFIFIAHDDHPVLARDVETGVGADKLRALKERLRRAHGVRTFRSAEELRTEIIHALSALPMAYKADYEHRYPSAPAATQRPWVTLKSVRLKEDTVSPGKRPTVVVEFENTGQVPALEVSSLGIIGIAEPLNADVGDFPIESVRLAQAARQPPPTLAIGAGGTVILPLTLADPLNDKDVAGLINDTGRFLIVYGIVEYQSTGGESYFSTFGCRTAGGFNTLRTYGKWTTAK